MNQLADETSPYLLQHAANPVDWHPWNAAALAKARAENKPILLSIGYSACHWCHVMAHESFEDPATAEVMNRHFVNIKVDREERPDLDKIYQTAHHFIAQRGRRLAADDVPHARKTTCRSSAAPTSRTRRSTACPPSPRCWSGSPGTTGTTRPTCAARRMRCARPSAGWSPAGSADASALNGAATGGFPRGHRAAGGPGARRLRRRAQVPPPHHHRPAAAPLAQHGPRPAAGQGRPVLRGAHAEAHGRGRHLRSPGRRLLPLLGGPLLDHPPLREDALRQRAAAGALRRRCSRSAATRASGPWPGKRPTGCCARCARRRAASTPASMRTRRARKAGSTSGRPEQVRALVDADEYAVLAPALRAGPAAEFRGAPPPRPRLAPAGLSDGGADCRSHRPAGLHGAPPAHVGPVEAAQCAQPARVARSRRQAADQLERADDPGPRHRGAGAGSAGPRRRRRSGRGLPAPIAGGGRPAARHLQGRAGAPQRLPGRLRLPAGCRRGTAADPVEHRTPATLPSSWPTACWSASRTGRTAASGSRPTTTRRCSTGRSHWPTRPCRRATASPPSPSPGSATCSWRPATWTRRNAPCGPGGAACRSSPTAIARC